MPTIKNEKTVSMYRYFHKNEFVEQEMVEYIRSLILIPSKIL